MIAAREILHSFKEFLAPRHCEACGDYTARSAGKLEFLCDTCISSLKAPPTETELMQRLLQHFTQDDLSISHFFSLMAVPLVGIGTAAVVVGEVPHATDWLAALFIAIAIIAAKTPPRVFMRRSSYP